MATLTTTLPQQPSDPCLLNHQHTCYLLERYEKKEPEYGESEHCATSYEEE